MALTNRVIIGVFLALVCLVKISLQICPTQCACTNSDRIVNCSGKALTSFPTDIGVDVQRIDISDNLLTRLDGNLKMFTQLEKLDASRNRIELVSSQTFHGLSILVDVSLKENKISTFAADTFKDQSLLTKLDVSSNRLHTLPPSLFIQCYKLSQLFIGDNELDSRAFETINQIRSLKTLRLEKNPLQLVPYLALGKLRDLEQLYLQNSSISVLDANAFVGPSSLMSLDLSHNALRDVKREAFQPFTHLGTLRLSGNPITCSCQSKQFQDWLKEAGALLDGAATCTVYDSGETIDIGSGDLTRFCDASIVTTPAPTSDPGACDQNAALDIGYERVSSTSVKVTWAAEKVSPLRTLHLTNRKFGAASVIWENKTRATSTGSQVIPNLDVDASYVVCGLVQGCDLTSCVDLISVGGAVSGHMSLPLIIVIGVLGGVCLILFIAIIVIATRRARRQKAPPVCETSTATKKYTKPKPADLSLHGNHGNQLPGNHGNQLPMTAAMMDNPYNPYEAIPDHQVGPPLPFRPETLGYDNGSFENISPRQSGRSMSNPNIHSVNMNYALRQQMMATPTLMPDAYLHNLAAQNWALRNGMAAERAQLHKARSMNDMLDSQLFQEEPPVSPRPKSVDTHLLEGKPRPTKRTTLKPSLPPKHQSREVVNFNKGEESVNISPAKELGKTRLNSDLTDDEKHYYDIEEAKREARRS